MLKRHFDRVDRDGNGKIDQDEFRLLLRELGLNRAGDVVSLAFQEIDGDGNGVIDYREFSRWWESRTRGGDEITDRDQDGLNPGTD